MTASVSNWQVKALVEATPTSTPRQNRQAERGFARHRGGRHIHHSDGFLNPLIAIAQGGERIGGLARLAYKDRPRFLRHRRFAVAELGRDVDLAGQARQAFEPVFRHRAGVIGGAAGNHSQPVEIGEIDLLGQVQPFVAQIVAQGIAQHGGLFSDFFGHEMLIAGFLDLHRAHVDLGRIAVRAAASAS